MGMESKGLKYPQICRSQEIGFAQSYFSCVAISRQQILSRLAKPATTLGICQRDDSDKIDSKYEGLCRAGG
ncbi:unnamed protein product [Fusarium graminearum]|nr:unnamed protein product [Fusarium graminearum]